MAEFGEIVRGHAGNDARAQVFIKGEEADICPDVGAILRYENRNVANNADAALVCIFFDGMPLFGE